MSETEEQQRAKWERFSEYGQWNRMADLLRPFVEQPNELMSDILARVVERAPRWIPVAEGLPSHEALVLVCGRGWARAATGRFTGYDGATPAFLVVEGDGDVAHDVTHWMPLPEPPKP